MNYLPRLLVLAQEHSVQTDLSYLIELVFASANNQVAIVALAIAIGLAATAKLVAVAALVMTVAMAAITMATIAVKAIVVWVLIITELATTEQVAIVVIVIVATVVNLATISKLAVIISLATANILANLAITILTSLYQWQNIEVIAIKAIVIKAIVIKVIAIKAIVIKVTEQVQPVIKLVLKAVLTNMSLVMLYLYQQVEFMIKVLAKRFVVLLIKLVCFKSVDLQVQGLNQYYYFDRVASLYK